MRKPSTTQGAPALAQPIIIPIQTVFRRSEDLVAAVKTSPTAVLLISGRVYFDRLVGEPGRYLGRLMTAHELNGDLEEVLVGIYTTEYAAVSLPADIRAMPGVVVV